MARPTRLTAELAQRITAAVGSGSSEAAAARANGVSERTYMRWKARGREADSNWADLTADEREREQPYRQFWHDVTQAWDRSMVTLGSLVRAAAIPHDEVAETVETKQEITKDGEIVTLTKTTVTTRHGVSDWRAALAILERRERALWGRAVEVTGAGGGPVEVEVSALDRARAAAAKLREQTERHDRG